MRRAAARVLLLGGLPLALGWGCAGAQRPEGLPTGLQTDSESVSRPPAEPRIEISLNAPERWPLAAIEKIPYRVQLRNPRETGFRNVVILSVHPTHLRIVMRDATGEEITQGDIGRIGPPFLATSRLMDIGEELQLSVYTFALWGASKLSPGDRVTVTAELSHPDSDWLEADLLSIVRRANIHMPVGQVWSSNTITIELE